QGIEGAKENTREQQSHIAPKRGAAAGERTRAHRPSLRPAKPNRPAGHDYADLRRRMPQNAAVSASVSEFTPSWCVAAGRGAVLRV
ncbi:hypothetical protein, partial [Escherichia coli]|uniref:hypothetical protein n=1 Tax=Escherichia coli TaxID=562 RepID=UPI001A7E0CD7